MTKQHHATAFTPLQFYAMCIMLVLLVAPVGNCRAADQPDWAQQVSRTPASGKLEQLNAGGKSFYAIISERIGRLTKGHILILHGHRQHPDWADVIKPVRMMLPKYGWNTLSIELPRASKEASDKEFISLLDQSTARMLAAQALLQGKGNENIIVLAYGLGARMAVEWLSKTPRSPVNALILISMADGKKESGLDSNTDLRVIKIPLLDIIAEHDSKQVRMAAIERYRSHSKNQQYRQLEILAADQYYKQHEAELVKRIRGWLEIILKAKTDRKKL